MKNGAYILYICMMFLQQTSGSTANRCLGMHSACNRHGHLGCIGVAMLAGAFTTAENFDKVVGCS
jgi:hypothetical protein